MLCVAALVGAAPATATPVRAVAVPTVGPFDGSKLDPRMWAHLDGGFDEIMHRDLSDLVPLVSTGDGGLPLAKYRWQVPDLVSTVEVPVVQIVNGLPVRFSAAVSKAAPDFLIKYYVEEFEKAGLYIPDADSQFELGPPVIQVTALDTDNLISYTVILQLAKPGYTTVVMGQGYLTPWLQRNKAGQEDIAPVFPGAQNVMRTHSEGLDILQYTSSAPVGELEAFFLETLKKSGYARAENDGPPALLFSRGAELLKIKVVKAPKKNESGVLIQRTMKSAAAQRR